MRRLWRFHGGIHPPQHKRQSTGTAIASAGIPELLTLPLTPAAEPCVSVGIHVLKGQRIAAATDADPMSVPVHAPTSGEIVAIEPRPLPHPTGMSAPCIVIRPDGRDAWIAHQGIEDYTAIERPQLLALIRQAGITGLGGAGFPTALKIGSDQLIETLLINGAECEPYVTADDLLMRERADEVIAGVSILRHLLQPEKETLIAVEDNKPEAIAALTMAAAGTGIEIVAIPTIYPSGGEGQLIQVITGKEVPSAGLPMDIDVICFNVGTAAAICRAVQLGEPLIQRITTVAGAACSEARNYDALIGTPLRHLLALSGYDQQRCQRLLVGGSMMGHAVASDDLPVLKTTSCVVAAGAEEMPLAAPAQACIRCGLCAEVCPASLLPQQLFWFARGEEFDKLEAHNLFDCIECGACAYVCPSQIPLVPLYRAAKADIREHYAERDRATRAKSRFEARTARIEREQAEKEARRAARQNATKLNPAVAPEAEAAATKEKAADVVQAAIERVAAKKAAQKAALKARTEADQHPSEPPP